MKMRMIKGFMAVMLVLGLVCTMVPKITRAEEVTAEAVLSKSSLTLTAGDSLRLKVFSAPEGSKVTWKSGRRSVAKVSSYGTVTARKAGTAKITATVTTGDNVQKLVCRVTVAAAGDVKQTISIKENAKVKTYKADKKDALNLKLVVPTITIKDNEKAGKAINTFFKKIKSEYYELAMEAYRYWPTYKDMLGDDVWPFEVELNYNTTYHKNNLLCVDFYWYVDQGGVHPSHGVISAVFDLATGERVKLADIVNDADKAGKALYNAAIAQFKADPIYADAIMYESYEDFTQYYSIDGIWSITKDGIELCFSSGDLMAYAAGTVSADIDISTIALYANEYGLNLLFPAANEDSFELDANPTTGYDWQVSYSTKGIVSCEGTYTQNEAAEGMVGVGGKTAFVVKPVKKGLVVVTLDYKRSWETESGETIELVYLVDSEGHLHKIK